MSEEREKLLEEIYKIDPMIKKASDKLQRLSEDEEFVKQYKEREKEIAKTREEQILKEIKLLKFDEEVHIYPESFQMRIRDLYDYCVKRGVPISSLNQAEAMKFVERVGDKYE